MKLVDKLASKWKFSLAVDDDYLLNWPSCSMVDVREGKIEKSIIRKRANLKASQEEIKNI